MSPDSPLDIRIESEPDLIVLLLRGEVDLGSTPELEAALNDAFASGKGVIVDISELRYMDSTGIRALHRVADAGPIAIVMSPKSLLARAIRLGGLDQLIPIFDEHLGASAYLRSR